MASELYPASDLRKSFELYDQQVTINNIQLGCLLGMILMPAGLILDYFVYPGQIGLFYNLRLLCSALIGVFWLFVRSPIGRGRYRLLGVLLALRAETAPYVPVDLSRFVVATNSSSSCARRSNIRKS